MQIKKLFKEFDTLQIKYGDKNLSAIYGAGEIKNPDICLVFMNPTARNISANKNWKGLKAPWIATKNVWKMFSELGLLKEEFFEKEIKSKKPIDWNEDFSEKVYREVKKQSLYITNLSKATQIDARPLKDSVFKKYLGLFHEEIITIRPKIIISFGNQVSSVLLGKSIRVGEWRKKYAVSKIGNQEYRIYPVYYPVGQGMRNIKKAKEDIKWIIKNTFVANKKTKIEN